MWMLRQMPLKGYGPLFFNRGGQRTSEAATAIHDDRIETQPRGPISKQKREYIIAPLSFFLGKEDLDAVVKTKESGTPIAVSDHRLEWRK